MTQYDNTNTGSLFKNKDRKTPKHPEYRGSINVDGQEFWLSAWVKEAGPNSKMAGEKFFSLSIQTKEDREAKSDELKQVGRPGIDPEDSIPF